MTGRSYLAPAAIARVTQVRKNALATFIELQDAPVTLQLYRGNVAITPQKVLTRYRKDRAPKNEDVIGAQSQQADGTFKKESPFDVAIGDVFTLPSGQRGRITMVPLAFGGIQRAEFVVDEGTI